MIVKTVKELNQVAYDHTYSDRNMMIERNGVRYSEAIDPLDSNREYIETDEPIFTDELSEIEEKARAYDVITGVNE